MYYYWPREEHGVVVHGKLKVTLLSEEPQEDYIIRKLELREDTQYHIPVRFQHRSTVHLWNIHNALELPLCMSRPIYIQRGQLSLLEAKMTFVGHYWSVKDIYIFRLG